MRIETSDIVLSVREHILTHPLRLRSGTAELVNPLPSQMTNLVVLPRGLDFNPQTFGPRIGITIPSNQDTGMYYGSGAEHEWTVGLEVDAFMKDPTTGQVDVNLSLRTMWLLDGALRELFACSTHIPCYFWAETGAFSEAGQLLVRYEPRIQQIAEATLYVESILAITVTH